MEKERPYSPRTARDARVDAIPALTIFVGAVVALVIGVIDPRKLFTLGGVIVAAFAIAGFVIRMLVPKDAERAPATRHQSFDLVIFDCDGVLVDTESICVAVEARVLTDLGWPMTPPEVARRWMGRSSAEQLAEIAEQLGAESAGRFDELTTAETRKEFERSLTAVDGVRPLLDHLDRVGLRYCVASSSTHERMRLTLGVAGLMGRFAGSLFSAEEVPQGKPAPDLFLLAAQRMGVPPERCAVVEDSVYGVQAAQRAGMTVFAYAGGLSEARALAGTGARVIHDLRDLFALLDGAEDEV
ncbi:MAG TPA: HAD family hydrolase [Nocardioidaceae bacterium]|nr:HAD family hydrolase [Nocardioidaceae bacterium]